MNAYLDPSKPGQNYTVKIRGAAALGVDRLRQDKQTETSYDDAPLVLSAVASALVDPFVSSIYILTPDRSSSAENTPPLLHRPGANNEMLLQRTVDMLDDQLSKLGSPITRHAAETIVIMLHELWTTGKIAEDPGVFVHGIGPFKNFIPDMPRTTTRQPWDDFDPECIPGN